MSSNIGKIDRFVRLSLGGILLYLGQTMYAGEQLGLALTVFGIVANVTAMVGFCPLYRLLGTSTRTDV
ncbi:MAG: DUF2892 domain-containing protein [Cyanobacteria bacterium SID2]|nr:DUF2892 domain-containing protein [Cyanobacteria bacterium SID2]MBP0005481.1 DUF2892 domain-containing protein [Cyanobacteria bacterium SBC]